MSVAEAIARSLTCWLALTAIAAYAIDALGFGVQPWVAVVVALGVTGAAAVMWPRPSYSYTSDFVTWLGIVIFMVAMFLRMSWPALVPPGRGPDLTHHLLLVDYIEQTGHLVHDRSLEGAMGEMAHYTPGSHLLAVIAGAMFGVDGLRAFFPLTVVCAALTAGFVFLIGRRMGLALPYAIAAVLMLFLPAQYFFGGFTHDAFLAQTVSTLFAVAAWWAIGCWRSQPTRSGAVAIAIFMAAMFLAWPIWLGPLALLFAAIWLQGGMQDLNTSRPQDLLIVFVPLLAIFVLHSWDRWDWLTIVRTSGAVLHPSLESVGFQLPLLAIIGLFIAARDQRARITIVLLFVIAMQAITFYGLAKAQGADTPYMAFKMMYFAIYPLAILAAMALQWALDSTLRTPNSREPIGWLIATALLVIVVRPALSAPREVPVIKLDLQAAGQWLRANHAAACSDYLVADPETAYWLHLAVLGNPRSGERMREIDRYAPNAAMAPWITAEGRSYAIADLDLLPAEVGSRVQIMREFGRAAVIARPGAIMMGCD